MMKLNRRTFFQAAALLPAAVLQSTVLQSKGRAIPAQAVAPAPVEIDLTEPGAVAYIGRGATDLFVQLEELAPADLGEPSGASLRIGVWEKMSPFQPVSAVFSSAPAIGATILSVGWGNGA